MTNELFAGGALGVAISCYFVTWYMCVRTRKHWKFMYDCLEARVSILEQELDRLSEDLGWRYDKDAEG